MTSVQTSVKCPQCDLVNFADAKTCKRCEAEIRPLKRGEMRSTSCPKCKSEDTQSFQMAYQTGTSKGRINAGTYSEGGGFGMAGGAVSTQTMLAGKLKPPANAETFMWGIVAVVVIVVMFLVTLGGTLVTEMVFTGTSPLIAFLCSAGLGILAGVGVLFVLSKTEGPKIEKIRNEYEKAMHKWSHSWICLRCGKEWMIN